VKLDPHTATAVHSKEPDLDDALTPELQLVVAYEVLHRLDMVEKSRSEKPSDQFIGLIVMSH
jgi:hypothetical protein